MGTPAALGLHFLPRLSWIRLISWISLVFIILHQFLLICSLDHMCLQSLWTARSAALKGLLLQVNHGLHRRFTHRGVSRAAQPTEGH